MAHMSWSAPNGTTRSASAGPAAELWRGLPDKIAQTPFLDRVSLTLPLARDGPTLGDLAEVLHLQSPALSAARLFDFDSAKHDLADRGVHLRGRLTGSGRCRLELRLRLEKTRSMPIQDLGSWRRLHPRTLTVELVARPHHTEHAIAYGTRSNPKR